MAVGSASSVFLFLRMEDVTWPLVAAYLNHLARLYPITANIIQSTQQGVWLEKADMSKPLPEDWMIRGLVLGLLGILP